MHGCISAPAGHGLARRLARATGLGLALTLVAAAAPARAETLVSPGDGVTAPAGMAVVDGKLWIADAELGLCRVGDPATESVTFVPGTRLVQSDYCGAQGETVAPSNTAQMAFDGQNFYVAEGTSKGAGVWRMTYSGGVITNAVRVVNTPDSRISALALAGDTVNPRLYFAGDGDDFVRRLDDPAIAPQNTVPAIVGQSTGTGVGQLAELGGNIYLAEASGVTKIAPGSPFAAPIPGLADMTPSALVADHAGQRLFVGTANPGGVDRVVSYDALSGAVEDYASAPTLGQGFSFITGLGLDGGDLLVGSDPAQGAGNPLPGGGQVDRVAPQAGVPHVRITGAPAVYTQLADVAFTFETSGGGGSVSLKCKLDTADPQPCGATESYTGLSEGRHELEVTPTAGTTDGPVVRHVFYVDRTAPTVSFANPAADRDSERTSLRLTFTTGELVARWECRIDDIAWRDCRSPTDVGNYDLGAHSFKARATDLAGNQGPEAEFAFVRRAPRVAPPAPTSGAPTITSPVPVAPTALAAPSAAAPAPRLRPCKGVAAPRSAGRTTLEGRRLTARITAPKGARFARLVLRKARGKGTATRLVARRAVKAGRPLNVRSTLTRTDAGRLRSGRYRLTVAYGTCAVGTYGASSPLTKKGARP